MSSSPTHNASPTKATSTCSESVTSTDNEGPPLYSKATAIQSPPRKRLRTEDDGGKVSSASNLHAPASALLTLPLDVLFEVLTHVDPKSLRHVSRTSQALRDTLTGPRSNWIWRASYANTDHGLPPAPDDMTVPQFLSLLVDRVCDFCQATPSPKERLERIWAARIKCCRNCLYHSEDIVCEDDVNMFPIVREIQSFLGPDYPLHKVFPASESYGLPGSRPYPRVLVERLAAEFSHAADKKAWLIKREKEHEGVLEHANMCRDWDLEQRWKQQMMANEVREERVREITKRMRRLEMECEESAAIKDELAWQLLHGSAKRNFHGKEGEHGYYSTPDEIHGLIHKCEPLADDDWIPIRVWLLHAAKTSQRRKTLQARYLALNKAYVDRESSCYSERDEYCMHPGIGDLVTFREVTDFIEGTPIEQRLTEDDMRALIDKLSPARFDAWLASCQSALVDMLNTADPHRARSATTADLYLATSIFHIGCTVHWYPDIIWRNTNVSNADLDPDDPQYIVHQCAWSAKEICVKPDRLRLATRLVTLAGLDPMTETVEDVRYAHFTLMSDTPLGKRFPNGIDFTRAIYFAKEDEDLVFDEEENYYFLCRLREKSEAERSPEKKVRA